MNIIEKKARKIAQNELGGGLDHPKEIIRRIRGELYEIDDDQDILLYLTILLEANDQAYKNHLKDECTNPENCSENDTYEEIHYFLQKELTRLGIHTKEDSFTGDEKERMTDYLNKILADLKDLKDGQEIVYDDLKDEIEELKRWFLLGKKNWRQMAVGKFGEMVAGGVISSTISEPILETFKTELPRLIS